MKKNTRISRINDEILKEVSQIIRGELKDPRIGVLTSVISVDTTDDLKYCKIFVSVLGNDDEKNNVMVALKNAAGFVRRLLAQRINLRATPELTFKLDESAEYAIHMDQLLNEIAKERENRGGDPHDE
ncbi:MAG: 30S ribosome-binding factor RbfA [Bacillota bacterium]